MDRKIESSQKRLIAMPNHWQDIMHSASRLGWRLFWGRLDAETPPWKAEGAV